MHKHQYSVPSRTEIVIPPSSQSLFQKMQDYNNFLSLFRKARGVILQDIGIEADGSIFVNKSLSKLNLQIFQYAMSHKKTNAIANVTTYNGIVQIRRLKTDSYIRVLSRNAIEEFLIAENSNSWNQECTNAAAPAPEKVAVD